MDYLDTSLLVAALTHEARTDEMQQWLAAQPPEELAISDWVVTEFSAALSLKLRTDQLDAQHRADALAEFTSLAESSFSVLPASRLDFHSAARLADRHESNLRSGDTLHLAIAGNHGMQLCSLDQRLVAAAESVGIRAVLL